MKAQLILIFAVLTLSSCCNCEDKKYNPSGLDPATMTEDALYSTYGLEAPAEFYSNLKSQMVDNGFGAETYCSQIENENPLSNLIHVSIEVDSLQIVQASVTRSDYSNKVNKLIERLTTRLKWKYEVNQRQSGSFDFRIDLKKLCEKK